MLLNFVRGGRLLACHSRSAIRYCQTVSSLQLGKSSTHEGSSHSQGALNEMKNKAATVEPLVFDRHREEGATALMKERQEHTAKRDAINEAFGQGLKSRTMAEVFDDCRTMSPWRQLPQGKSAHECASCSPGAFSEMENNAATVDPLVIPSMQVGGGRLLDCHSGSPIRYFRTMSPLQQGNSAHEADSRSPGAFGEMKNNAATVDPLVLDCHRGEGATALTKERLEHSATREEINEAFRQGLKSRNMAGVCDDRRTMSLRRHKLQLLQGKSAHEGASRSPGAATVDPWFRYRDRVERAIAILKEKLEDPGTRDDMKESIRQRLEGLNMVRESEEKLEKFGFRTIVLC